MSQTQSLITVTRSGLTVDPAALVRGSKPNSHVYNLVTLLGAIQVHHVDFLPITWPRALGSLGKGATGSIHQSPLSLQESLAFKRIQPSLFSRRSVETRQEGITAAFHALISEITVLALVRRHPNISSLLGICWDIVIDCEHEQAWPVLVFKKAPHGNLDEFLKNNSEAAQSWDVKVRLLAGIASAVAYMHSRKIIHGDINPRNILIFEDTPGKFTARVTDFGYSTVNIDDSLIMLPSTAPWVHPDHHRNGYSIDAAKRMDAYTFGMVCFWLFFRHLDNYPNSDTLEQEKRRKNMPELAATLVHKAEIYDMKERSFLIKLFNSTLNHDHDLRMDFEQITNMLEKHLGSIISTTTSNQELRANDQKIKLYISEAEFQVALSVYQLYLADFRVRIHIFNALSQLLHSSQASFHLKNVRKTSFQLSLCYAIGFGVKRDITKSRELLELSKSKVHSLELQLKVVRDSSSYHFFNLEFEDIWSGGLIQGMDLAEYYRGSPSLSHDSSLAIEVSAYEREIEDLVLTLSLNHPLVLSLKSTLASLLYNRGSWLDASKLFGEVLGLRQENENQSNENQSNEGILESMSDLAVVYSDLGQFDNAEKLALQVTEGYTREFGDKHPSTMASMEILASIYISRGDWLEAERITEKSIQVISKVRGDEHPHTLRQLHRMVQIRIDQCQWSDAESLGLENFKRRAKVLGATHSDTLQSRLHLASVYDGQGKWEKAAEIESDVIHIYTQSIGDQHPDTLDIISNLGMTYGCQGRWDEAETICKKVAHDTEQILGPQHPNTIASLAALSTCYRERSKFSEAEQIDQRVHEISLKTLGPDHHLTITSLHDLAFTYSKRDRPKEAEEIILKVIGSREKTLGQDHNDTMTSRTILASALSDQRRYEEAIDIEKSIFEKRKVLLGEDHPDTLISMSNLATAYWNLDDWAMAEELEVSALTRCREALGFQHPHTLSAMTNLAATYVNLDNLEKAHPLAIEALELSQEVRGMEHENTWAAMAQVAEVYHKQRRLAEARDMYQKVLDLTLEGLGEDSWQYMETAELLARVVKDIEETE